jgi:small subunit ribosomal protein S27Ae
MPRHEYYEDGETVKEACPRCENSFLADHGDRKHCGQCGYTEWE